MGSRACAGVGGGLGWLRDDFYHVVFVRLSLTVVQLYRKGRRRTPVRPVWEDFSCPPCSEVSLVSGLIREPVALEVGHSPVVSGV